MTKTTRENQPTDLLERLRKQQEQAETLFDCTKQHKQEAAKLLAEANNHWGGEDGFYRFYHQSFKVFFLQESTRKMADFLRAIGTQAGVEGLHPYFEEIISEGTGKRFEPATNSNWCEETRPILEAFFHAREMLKFLVKYAEMSELPQCLPSGLAAILCLYKQR
jgi:hypothetical protein